MRIGLVACVKSKKGTAAPAADLYTSPLFVGGRRAVEANCDKWFILSAKHGLLDPTAVVDPYEETLKGASRGRKRSWSRQVLDELSDVLGDVAGVVFEVHAGQDYHAWGLTQGLRDAGAEVELPTAGLSMGRKLAHYRDQRGSGRSLVSDRSLAAAQQCVVPPPIAVGTGDVNAPRPSSNYRPLYEHLGQLDHSRWAVTFEEVEAVLGRSLPKSARSHAAWWANDATRHSHARAWLASGWRTSELQLESEHVTFVKEQRSE